MKVYTKIIAYGFSIESLLYRVQEYAKHANTEYKYKKKPLARLIIKEPLNNSPPNLPNIQSCIK